LPIQATIKHAGYEAAFLWFGLGQGLVVFLCGLAVRFPTTDDLRPGDLPNSVTSGCDSTPRDVVASPAFWLLYAMMTVAAIPGLLMSAQLAPMAADFGIKEAPVTLFCVTLAALPFALMLDRLTGGLTRPVFGWISDRVGRESAMFVAFALEGTA